MRAAGSAFAALAFAGLAALPVAAQQEPVRVTRDDQTVGRATGEAWAMRYLAGTTLLTSFGELPRLEPGRWSVMGDLGHIPRLSKEQQTIGLGGVKTEDLNKSPVFGRLRGAIGLPGGWVAELAWTPPLEIDGSEARQFFAAAIGTRIGVSPDFTISARLLGQAGEVKGDITCPARIAGNPDFTVNPYGCREPSKDVFGANYFGVDATAAWRRGQWSWHASAGLVKTHLTAQVDAQLDGVNERTKLTSRDALGWLAAGGRYAFDRRWSASLELLYVPLEVVRFPSTAKERDDLASVRAQLRYDFE